MPILRGTLLPGSAAAIRCAFVGFVCEGEGREGQEITVEHEVAGTVALYRIKGENAAGFVCELVLGEPVIFRQGKRVALDEAV